MRGNQPDPAASVRDRAQSEAIARRRGRILVTGASGGTGRRVVRDLLSASRKVRALTRSRERLIEALATLGIDAEAEEKKGTLDIYVSDLYNIRPEMFVDVIGVASCTGVKVGPADDDADRTKYYQGLVFYPPEVLEDTPQNVEYVGIRNLVEGARDHFGPLGQEQIPILQFTDPKEVEAQWGPLDDVVMGGVSKSGIRIEKGNLVFSGFVSTDNFGGFASTRTIDFKSAIDLKDYDGFALRVKGDGKSYKMIIRCEQKWDGIAHCYTFPTKSGEWTELRIPFSDFNTVFRAKTLKDGKPLDPSSIFAFQFMLSKFEYDGELNQNFSAGPFELRVSSVKAYRTARTTVAPKIVHIGSAGCTRVLRQSEFPDLESQPPAVRMNEMLGRILEWKLAGEDVIRTSGVPYCIFRPCALTVEDGAGVDALEFAQGDNITGMISREDLAPLVVQAFNTPVLTNVTAEVRQEKEGTESGKVDEKLEVLKPNGEENRKYADYPFVPDLVRV